MQRTGVAFRITLVLAAREIERVQRESWRLIHRLDDGDDDDVGGGDAEHLAAAVAEAEEAVPYGDDDDAILPVVRPDCQRHSYSAERPDLP